jgi:hypothetical protein
MSTKVGVICEGASDFALLSALLRRIAADKAGIDWRVTPDDVAESFPVRKRGHGGVLEAVKRLISVLHTDAFDHAFFVIVLDRRTKAVQQKVRKLIRGKNRFVLGIAIQEIEAWWLGDRVNTLAWAELDAPLPHHCRYAAEGYRAERDKAPKKTLDELTELSDRFDRHYGVGNVDMANEFAEEYLVHHARLDDIAAECPKGFAPLQTNVAQVFARGDRDPKPPTPKPLERDRAARPERPHRRK